MPRPATVLLAVAGLAALLSVTCSGGDSQQASRPNGEGESAAAEAAPQGEDRPAALSPTDASGGGVEASSAEPDADGVAAGVGLPSPATGSPFGGQDLLDVLAALGLHYGPEDHDVGCGPDVPPKVAYGSRSYLFPDEPDTTGQSFLLFVYPDPESAAAAWPLGDGGRVVRTPENCVSAESEVYRSQNLILEFHRTDGVNAVHRAAIIAALLSLSAPQQQAEVTPQLLVSPSTIRQGEAALVRLTGTATASAFLTVDGVTTPMADEQGDWVGFAPVRSLSPLGPRHIVVDVFDEAGTYETTFSAAVEVVDADVPIEEITLLPSDADLLAPELVAIDNGVRFVEHTGVSGPRRWRGVWRLPIEGEPTGIFGALRSFNGAPPSDWHHGYDIAAAAGAPIGAPAAGVVVFADELPVHGIGLILDHGAGVYSGYWHMSAVEAAVGDVLRAGDLLGRIGESGLAVGPHLHWEVIVHGRDVDPLQWLDPALHQ